MSGTALDIPLQIDTAVDAVPLRSVDELVDVIREGLAAGYCGELEVHDRKDAAARVCIDRGRLAWVHCSTHGEHLGDVLRRECGLSPAHLRLVMTRCRATGERFGESLAALGLVSMCALREALRAHLAAHSAHVMALGEGLRASFHPVEHRYDRRLTFAFDDLPWRAPDPASSPIVVATRASELVHACERARETREAPLWVGFVDLRDGGCLAESHAEGLDGSAIQRAVLRDAHAIVSAASPRGADREIEAVLHGSGVAVGLRVFLTSNVTAALIASASARDAEVSIVLHSLAQAARHWQAAQAGARSVGA
ncbi:MAG: hypothetical protein IPH07_17570 [Deltaproteobacteria bacterium]|nr:hypothetical protein [Deltaproteobacteria bacterium]MBK8238627.1 hypothetical protein [Deltaproteobacteria bacterium]MBK8719380.1 hypothetical protein [Deltaproteobacteria bacterium]MBP7292146.1 hypothetical protein [Nannocystaceae bacterium]